MSVYRGRLAPTPTGLLHAGHAATFRTAWQRARAAGGRIVLRIEDLDPRRCKAEYAAAAMRDLAWIGLDWDEGPLYQSARRAHYLDAWRALRDAGVIYPCARSRRDVAGAALAPHDEEPIFPPGWRGDPSAARDWESPAGINWRFRVPDGEAIRFRDQRLGMVARTAGSDFGDFLVWNRDDVPAYELAVVVDDLDMRITEIVRGEDLLTSTARQVLVSRALGASMPATFHCPLVRDAHGRRLAKRSAALSIAAFRERGDPPAAVCAGSPMGSACCGESTAHQAGSRRSLRRRGAIAELSPHAQHTCCG